MQSGSLLTLAWFVQEKKVIILLTGRYAGKKAVIIRNHDDGTPNRKYGHAEVLVLTKEPRKVSCEIEGLSPCMLVLCSPSSGISLSFV